MVTSNHTTPRLICHQEKIRPQSLFVQRVEKLQKMRDKGIGALFLHPGVNTYYFTGMMKPSYERLLTIIISESGDATTVVPAFEAVENPSEGNWNDHSAN